MCFIIDLVETLDLDEICQYYEWAEDDKRRKAASGQPPFHPKMMMGLLLYAYSNGAPSAPFLARHGRRVGLTRIFHEFWGIWTGTKAQLLV